MQFADRGWLMALWLVPALALLALWARSRRQSALKRLADAGLVPRLTREVSHGRRLAAAILLLAAVSALTLAAARPQFGARLRNVKRRGIDLVVALDVSNSMLAQDFKPSRLQRAKRELVELMGKLKGDRLGLVAFAGKAVPVCPLTLDYDAVNLLLNAVSTETAPEQGTSIADAIRVALGSYVQKETKYKALLVLTDGEDHEGDLDAAAQEARKAGVRIYAVGIGGNVGEPVPVLDPQGRLVGYKKDPSGQMVLSRLDEEPLIRLARATGGQYFRAGQASLELERVASAIDAQEKKDLESGVMSQYQDQFHWFAAAAMALLLLEWLLGERRRGGARATA